MTKRTNAQIRSYAKMARAVSEHHFGKNVNKVEYKPAGKTNYVFEVKLGTNAYIIRISDDPDKLNDFVKEHWACRKAAEQGVPVPEILDIGHKIIPQPYMLQVKEKGAEAVDHPERAGILKKLGEYARKIHSIETTGFGGNFDWTENQFAKSATWKAYLQDELRVNDRLEFLQKNKMLSTKKTDSLFFLFEKIRNWKFKPSLNHGDLRLKNVIVDKEGKISAIIDWEHCVSHMAPYWDFSIALHDLSIDNKQRFLEGYGLDFKTFSRMSYALTAFNLVNYVPTLESLLKQKNKDQLEYYKLRLNGALDLFSL